MKANVNICGCFFVIIFSLMIGRTDIEQVKKAATGSKPVSTSEENKKHGLNQDAKVIEVSTSNFESEVLKAELPVLLHFYAPWVGPSIKMTPILEEIAKDYRDKIKVGKINADENTSIAEKYSIKQLPTFIIYKEGTEKERMTGPTIKEKFERALSKYIDNK